MTKHELTPEVISQIVDFAKKYEPKRDLVGIHREVISKMLQRQYEQNGKWDVTVFEKDRLHNSIDGGFYWHLTIEYANDTHFWKKTISCPTEPDFKTFFTRYPERFESEPQYRDSLGYPLEIGEEIYIDDNSINGCIDNLDLYIYKGMDENIEYSTESENGWKYAVSAKAYQNNPSEVMERIKQLEQKNKPEQMNKEEKPTKPKYVTPCGTFTEGEMVKIGKLNLIFYKYDERTINPYICVSPDSNDAYLEGRPFDICIFSSEISKIIPLPTIEEVANKAGITVEQLREVVKQSK